MQWLAAVLACDKSAVYDEKLETLLNHLCPKKALHEYGVSQEELEDFTDVMTSQGRLMANNYTELDRDEVRAIYERLY